MEKIAGSDRADGVWYYGGDVDFAGSRWFDLGPGQFDFGVLAQEKGATVTSLDKDPAVVELGRYLGFETIEGDIRDIATLFAPHTFDGVFCKYSVNALWFRTEDDVREHVEQTAALVKPGGWGWIAPWNGIPKKLTIDEAEPLLATQRQAFLDAGWTATDLSEKESRYYGVHGKTANRVIFSLRP